MKILLTLIVLFFSSSVVAELPTSLFDVEILEKSEKFLKDPELHKFNKKICNTFLDKPRANNIMFKKDNLFERKCIKVNQDKIITEITAGTGWDYYDDFKNSDLNEYSLQDALQIYHDLLNSISTVFNIKQKKLNNIYLVNVDSDGSYISVKFHINYKDEIKGNLLLHGSTYHLKSANPGSGAGRIGMGGFYIHLTSDQESIENYLKFKNNKLKKIRKKDLDEYINLFHSSASVF